MHSLPVRKHTHCRVCGTKLGDPYLDLGCQPLANALVPERSAGVIGHEEFVAPLQVAVCTNCGLSQLSVVVDPAILYGGYKFRSGASFQWISHCDELARQATETFRKPGWVLDIAANDGTQLRQFAERGWGTVGVEPADIPTTAHVGRIERAFWGMDVAQKIRREHQAFDLVVAQNVFGHVDDPVAFLAATEHVLAPDGRCAIEVPHVRDLLVHCAFDTIYHEHLSYWNTGALIRAAKQANLALDRIEHLKVHGGSKRYWLKRNGQAPDEHPAFSLPIDPMPYRRFANEVERRLIQTIRKLETIHAGGKSLWAYGASAKGTVMLNALQSRGNTVWPEVILDDVQEKQGFVSPGVHIPIRAPAEDWPDVLWILSWNWREQLKERARLAGFRGEFFLTHPTVTLES